MPFWRWWAWVGTWRSCTGPAGPGGLLGTLKRPLWASDHRLLNRAEHIARSPHTRWRTTTPAATEQWAVDWSEDDTDSVDSTTAELLRYYRDRTAQEEGRAERDRPADPLANWSGWWWSTPPRTVR